MRTRSARARTVALVAVLALGGAACSSKGGSDSSSDKATTTTAKPKATTTTSTSTTTTTEVTTTTAGNGPSEDQIVAFVKPLLMTTNDLGDSSFQPEALSDTKESCGVDFDKEYPADARVGTELTSDSLQLGFQEVVRVYGTEADAATGYQAIITKALACGTTEQDYTVSKGTDVSSMVAPTGADVEATAYEVSGGGVQGVIIVAHFSDAIVTFQFAGSKDADTSKLASPPELAKTGLQKIVDGLPKN